MARQVLILGFEGVQALDMIGPFDVFTGASLYAGSVGADGYDVRVVSVRGEPVSTGTGLTIVAESLPDPNGPVDTVVLPGGHGTEAARKHADLVDWIVIQEAHPKPPIAYIPRLHASVQWLELVRGHLVADLVTADETEAGELVEIALEALTVEDC